jgi:hypothetical protein
MTSAPRPSPSNRRSWPRVRLRQPATVSITGSPAFTAETCDLARDGIGFASPRPISPGRRGEVAFELPSGGGGLTLPIKVVHSSYVGPHQFQIGAAFLELRPEAAQAIAAFLETA